MADLLQSLYSNHDKERHKLQHNPALSNKNSNTLNTVLTFKWYVNNSTDQGFEKLILSRGNNESTDNGNLSASLQCVAALWNRVLTAGPYSLKKLRESISIPYSARHSHCCRLKNKTSPH